MEERVGGPLLRRIVVVVVVVSGVIPTRNRFSSTDEVSHVEERAGLHRAMMMMMTMMIVIGISICVTGILMNVIGIIPTKNRFSSTDGISYMEERVRRAIIVL